MRLFYSKDAYILLRVPPPDENPPLLTIFFWLGQLAEKDKITSAAIRATQLNQLLGGAAKHQREEEGCESEFFLAQFPQGLEIDKVLLLQRRARGTLQRSPRTPSGRRHHICPAAGGQDEPARTVPPRGPACYCTARGGKRRKEEGETGDAIRLSATLAAGRTAARVHSAARRAQRGLA